MCVLGIMLYTMKSREYFFKFQAGEIGENEFLPGEVEKVFQAQSSYNPTTKVNLLSSTLVCTYFSILITYFCNQFL